MKRGRSEDTNSNRDRPSAGPKATAARHNGLPSRPNLSLTTNAPNHAHAPPRKRQKMYDARTIAIKSLGGDAFQDGALDVGTFIGAREFEIRSLTVAMQRSKSSNTKRAFQTVPRDMRRRTASHNAKRVPKRLRHRAKQEMNVDNTATGEAHRQAPRPRVRLRRDTAVRLQRLSESSKVAGKSAKKATDKADPSINTLQAAPTVYSKFRRRQRNKTWLPTHIWTAKRAFMDTVWGFSIPRSPTLKCYRPTHRASSHNGCVAWDTSYVSTFMIDGDEKGIKRVLRDILPPKDMALIGKSVVEGRRPSMTWIHEKKMWPRGAVCPATLFWLPAVDSASRQVVARMHPSASLQAWAILLESCMLQEPKCMLIDLRYEIGSLEIYGPTADDVLKSILQPVEKTTRYRLIKCMLPGTQSTSLALDVQDPRLFIHPTLSSEPTEEEEEDTITFAKSITEPTLFNVKHRRKSVKMMASQKRIFARKSSALPGQNPEPRSEDPCVPLLCIAPSNNSSETSNSQQNYKWTVLLPWEWVLPFWVSLMHTPGVRFGGLKEFDQILFERGEAHFPNDMVGTNPGKLEMLRHDTVSYKNWEARGKSKKAAWQSLRLGSDRKGEVGGPGWGFDWKRVLGLNKEDWRQTESNNQTVPTPTPTDAPTKLPDELWHLTPQVVSLLNKSSNLFGQDVLRTGLFTVRVHFQEKGHLRETARIYRLPEDFPKGSNKWHLLKRRLASSVYEQPLDADVPRPNEDKNSNNTCSAGLMNILPRRMGYPDVPDESHLIGHITRGGFSLSEGQTIGIGVLAWSATFLAIHAAKEEIGSEGWCIVRNVGESVGRLAKWYSVA